MQDHSKMHLVPHGATITPQGPRKLGRKAIKTDTRTLRLRDYLTQALPPPPPSADWSKGIATWGMMMNDTLGDCTIAGCGHAVQVWTANTGSEVTLPDATIEQYYEQWDGYNPDDPSTDQGGVELDVLTDWRKQGFGGHKLLGFADPQASNQTEIQQAIALFGGCYIGMNVPNYIIENIPQVWDLNPSADNGIDGGHCVYCVGYDADGVTFVSWGSLYKMTWAYWNQFVDEAHALLSEDWLSAKGSPSGFNQAQLAADLNAIK